MYKKISSQKHEEGPSFSSKDFPHGMSRTRKRTRRYYRKLGQRLEKKIIMETIMES